MKPSRYQMKVMQKRRKREVIRKHEKLQWDTIVATKIVGIEDNKIASTRASDMNYRRYASLLTRLVLIGGNKREREREREREHLVLVLMGCEAVTWNRVLGKNERVCSFVGLFFRVYVCVW